MGSQRVGHNWVTNTLTRTQFYLLSQCFSKVSELDVLVTQLCLTVCHPMDYSPPGSSVHGILQGRILEWVAILFSRGSSLPRDRTQVSCVSGRCFTVWALGKSETPLNFKIWELEGDQLMGTWSQSESVKVRGINLLVWLLVQGSTHPATAVTPKGVIDVEDGTVEERNHCHYQGPYSVSPA